MSGEARAFWGGVLFGALLMFWLAVLPAVVTLADRPPVAKWREVSLMPAREETQRVPEIVEWYGVKYRCVVEDQR